MKRLLILMALAMGMAGAQAQVPAEVTGVMDKCRAAMTNAAGLEYEMDMRAGVGPLTMTMHLTVAEKGTLKRSAFTSKIMGIETFVERGFDGTDTWEIKHSDNNDTIFITPGDQQEKGKASPSLDLDTKYNKAKMKLKDGYYEITFSEPKDKKNEAKSITVKISAKNYTMRQLRSSVHGATVTMTITKIRVGLKDSHFKLDLAQYPNAVVIKQ